MNEPDYKTLADKFPHLGLDPEEVKAAFMKDGPRNTAIFEIERRLQVIADLEEREAAVIQELYDLEAKNEELRAALKNNDKQTRITRGRRNQSTYHVSLARKKIKSLEADIRQRDFQVFDRLVRAKLAAIGKSLRRPGKGGGKRSLKTFEQGAVLV